VLAPASLDRHDILTRVLTQFPGGNNSQLSFHYLLVLWPVLFRQGFPLFTQKALWLHIVLPGVTLKGMPGRRSCFMAQLPSMLDVAIDIPGAMSQASPANQW